MFKFFIIIFSINNSINENFIKFLKDQIFMILFEIVIHRLRNTGVKKRFFY